MFFVIDWFLQFLVLTRKNILINVRNWKTTLFVLLSPVLIVVGLNLMSTVLTNNIEAMLGGKRQDVLHPKPAMIPLLPPCTGFGARKCVTLRFSPPDALPIIQTILTDNQLSATDYVAYDNDTMLSDFILMNPNTTMIGLNFFGGVSQHGDISYVILYNDTETRSDPLSVEKPVNLIPRVQLTVDNAIVKHKLSKLWGQSFNQFPKAKNYMYNKFQDALNDNVETNIVSRIIDISLRSVATPKVINSTNTPIFEKATFEGFLQYILAGFFLQFSIVMFWIALLYYIVWEKSLNLRFAMTIMGMRNNSWWHSWFVAGFVQMLCAVLAVYVTGLAFKMKIFLNTNPLIILIIFCSFGVSLISVAMLLSVITTSNRAAILVAFIINGIAFFTSMITSNGIIIYAIFTNMPSVYKGLSWFPPFHFCKCIADLITITYGLGGATSPTDNHYTWKVFTHEITGLVGKAPPTFHNVLLMWAISAVLLIAAWYLDHILPTSMNGKSKPVYFFVLPSFWGLSRKKTNLLHITNALLAAKPAAIQLAASEPDRRVSEQITKTLEQQENEEESDVLRVVQVEKTYGGLLKKQVKAVQNVTFKANKGTCLALLGHNGAGKSTIISTIIGQNDLTAGHCFVFGKDVKTDMDLIRRDIGVCMQDDFLNPNMTAWEHLQLFAQFKNVPNKKQEIEQRLHDVGLYSVRNNQTRTFSGGMKRRLSCAIALIGSPSMVILDEPTTGLDVQSKRLIWNLVHQMKKDKLVLLTTHAMEEADKLGDQIVIMAYGKIKCMGNSLQLKNQFGAGFNIQVTANVVKREMLEENTESEQMHQQLVTKMNHIQDVIRKHVPQAEEVSQQANSLLYKLPQVNMKELIPLVQEIESISISKQGEEKAIVKSFHLSQSTLEEVYLSVTKQANFGVSSDRHS